MSERIPNTSCTAFSHNAFNGEKVGNVTFGGAGRDVLYVAASTSLYRIRLATRGVQRP